MSPASRDEVIKGPRMITVYGDFYAHCWLYPQLRTTPYGRHRQAYEILVGPIPEGLELHHKCRQTRCYNPTHLVPVTPSENMHEAAPWISAALRGKPFSDQHRASQRRARSPQGRARMQRIGRLADVRASWARADRTPVRCECGAGPFRGSRGLAMHRGKKHK